MKYFSNEIVFRGHPDKVCDQISARLLHEYMLKDKNTRAGIEVCGGKGVIFVTGEVTSKAKINVVKIVNGVLKDVGYRKRYKIINNIGQQSSDIALGVDNGGAGDQGMMVGYACSDTTELLPTAMVILQQFAEEYDKLRIKQSEIFYSDGKCQITGIYDKNFNLKKIKDFTISYQNCETNRKETDEIIKSTAINICKKFGIEVERFLINPTGKFLIGGFEGDAGLTGRKIVIDSYQSFAPVGGGCMNGKDPSKVDFSAAHKAREIAKRMLMKKHLKWCEVQISYAIGIAKPLAIYIDSDKGNLVVDEKLYDECTPKQIIKDLQLLNCNFEEFAKFGHFKN